MREKGVRGLKWGGVRSVKKLKRREREEERGVKKICAVRRFNNQGWKVTKERLRWIKSTYGMKGMRLDLKFG